MILTVKENMKAVASFVAKALKALSKLSNERKARIAKTITANLTA